MNELSRDSMRETEDARRFAAVAYQRGLTTGIAATVIAALTLDVLFL
jgi:hypothetical protein